VRKVLIGSQFCWFHRNRKRLRAILSLLCYLEKVSGAQPSESKAGQSTVVYSSILQSMTITRCGQVKSRLFSTLLIVLACPLFYTLHGQPKSFDRFYGGALAHLPSWKSWVEGIQKMSTPCRGAFDGTVNLHQYRKEIGKLAETYEQVRREWKGSWK